MATSDARKVLLLYTGGTIGMDKGPRGYRPVAGMLEKMIHGSRTFQDPNMPPGTTPPSRHGRHICYEIKEYSPLYDSSNMDMDDWVHIARDIERYYDEYDAFIVLHGTDTMAYTASALSFMLEGLDKTVIVTGSQIPISQVRNDGVDNLLDSLILCGHYEIPEVGLYFRSQLLRGNRARKVDASGLEAFASGNFPPLAIMDIDVEVNWEDVRAPTGQGLSIKPISNHNVATLRLFPGISTSIVDNFLRPPIEGVVLETYGAGNAPDNRDDFLATLREASERGVVIVNTTQCHRGEVALTYAAGTALAEVGVISGGDMTPEAALTKLAWLLSRALTPDDIRAQMQVNLRGELTARENDTRFSFREKAFVDSVARALATSTRQDKLEIQRALYPVLMCSAAGLGDVAALRRMIESGADVNAGDYDGRTALHLAAAEGQSEAVAYLVERGANPRSRDRWGGTPVDDAERYGNPELIARLRAALDR